MKFELRRSPSQLYKISHDTWTNNVKDAGEYYSPILNIENLALSELKMDESRRWTPKSAQYNYMLELVEQILEVPLTTQILTDEQTKAKILMKKSPGFPWRKENYKTRLDVSENTQFQQEILYNLDHIPIYSTTGKSNEWLDTTDIMAKKCRTFIAPPYELLYYQIQAFSEANENLKMYEWSYYGFNPFMGGVHRLAIKLLSKPYRGMIDWKGYDRQINLKTVVPRRFRFLKSNYSIERIEWIVRHTSRGVLKLTNGDLIERKRGNNSGQGSTTPMNIEAAIETWVYLLVCAYFDKTGKFPSLQLLLEQVLALFGDDGVFAVDEKFSLIVDIKWFKENAADLGLELKSMVAGYELPLEKLSFLGFTFLQMRDLWLPKWPFDRLVTPIYYTLSRQSDSQYLSRFYSILHLLYPHNDLTFYRDLYVHVLQTFQNSSNPEVKVFLRLGAPQLEYLFKFYLGYEARGGTILPSADGGPKYEFSNQMSQQQRGGRRNRPPGRVQNKPAPAKPTYRPQAQKDDAPEPKNQSITIPKKYKPVQQNKKVQLAPRNKGAQVEKDPWDTMSACAHKYAMAVSNPFRMVGGSDTQNNKKTKSDTQDGRDACIPTFPPLKSRRAVTFVSGSFYTGVNSMGYIVMAPRRTANNYGPGHDQMPIIASSATTSPGTAFPVLDIAGALAADQLGFNFNGDYPTSALVVNSALQGVTARVVCAGIRIRYVGQELLRGGIIHAIEQPNHESLSQLSVNGMAAFESHFRCKVDRNWCTLVYTPTLASEFDYKTDFYSNFSGQPADASYDHYMGFFIEGAAVGQPFEFEAVMLQEVVGQTVRDLKEATADPMGLAGVLNAINPTTQARNNMEGPVKTQDMMAKSVTNLTGSPMLGEIASTASNVLKLAAAFP